MFALRILIVAGVLLSFTWLILSAIGYLFIPTFFDHAEMSIASVAAFWWKGNPIYTDISDPHRYSLLYGPIPYIFTALFQVLGPETIILTKLTGVINLVCILCGALILARKLNIGVFYKIFCVSSVGTVLTGFYNYSYWVRPDSFLTTYVFLAFVLVNEERIPSFWVYLGLPLLAALAVNCKAYAVIYFIPLAVYYIEQDPQRWSYQKAIFATVMFLLASLAPFVLPGVDFRLYLQWLELASQHGLLFDLFLRNLTLVMAFLILLLVLGFYQKGKYTFWMFCLGCLIVSLAGSKLGAGTNHLMPFLPVMIWMSIECFVGLSIEEQKRVSYIVGAFLLTLNLNALNRQKRIASLFSETPERLMEFADLKNLSRKYPQAELGFTSLDSYLSTSYRPWLVSRNGSLSWDGSSLMDLAVSGVYMSPKSIDVIMSCQVKYFIFPAQGHPWDLKSLYHGENLFSSEFVSSFQKTYKLIESTSHFSVYGCAHHVSIL